MSAPLPPQPVPDADTCAWWAATDEGRLEICRCDDCGTWVHPPLERCRRCFGPTTLHPVSGDGTVHSYFVLHQALVPGLPPGPNVIVVVDLDDSPGARVSGRLVGVAPADVAVGTRVRSRIVPVAPGRYHQPEFLVAGD